jgi:hypothetical protein
MFKFPGVPCGAIAEDLMKFNVWHLTVARRYNFFRFEQVGRPKVVVLEKLEKDGLDYLEKKLNFLSFVTAI